MGKLLMIVLLGLVALFTSTTVLVDGTARGKAMGGAFQVSIGPRRTMALAFCEYRPGRVYYRLAAGVEGM